MRHGVLLTVFTLLFSSSVYAGLPKNDLHLEDQMFRFFQTIDEAEFNALIDEVIQVYQPIIESHGKTLVVDRKWEDATVNAYAQQIGDTWKIAMFGGLARRPEVTPDGFALVVCHEIGHHLAGFPFYGDSDWAASEGQSDYFASQVCARKVWGPQVEKNAEMASEVHPLAKRQCDEAWETEEDRHLCYRIAMAGYSLADLLGTLGGSRVSFEQTDERVVSKTQTSHPAGQCRLDTYFSGALCDREVPEAIIPGKDHPEGQTSAAAEEVAAAFSCMRPDFFEEGSRPTCWFAPQRESMIGVDEARWVEVYGNDNGVVEPGEAWEITNRLVNRTGFSYEDFPVALQTKREGVVPIRAASEIRRLKPFSITEQSDPFLVYFDEEMSCGQDLSLDVGVHLSERRQGRLLTENQIGRFIPSKEREVEPALHIPKVERDGVVSAIWVPQPGQATFANVSVDIKHTYIGDISIYLISPGGKEFLLREPHGGSQDDINETYRVRVDQPQTQGVWGLRIVDRMSPDSGELTKWSLQFEAAQCEEPVSNQESLQSFLQMNY